MPTITDGEPIALTDRGHYSFDLYYYLEPLDNSAVYQSFFIRHVFAVTAYVHSEEVFFSCAATICLHGVDRVNFTFTFLSYTC
jgi:hypothetical protein